MKLLEKILEIACCCCCFLLCSAELSAGYPEDDPDDAHHPGTSSGFAENPFNNSFQLRSFPNQFHFFSTFKCLLWLLSNPKLELRDWKSFIKSYFKLFSRYPTFLTAFANEPNLGAADPGRVVTNVHLPITWQVSFWIETCICWWRGNYVFWMKAFADDVRSMFFEWNVHLPITWEVSFFNETCTCPSRGK